MFEKILVPLDGSEHSLKALDKAVQIAKRFGGKITLVNVYSVSVQPLLLPEPTVAGVPTMPVLTAAEITRIGESARSVGRRILDDGAEKAKEEEVKTEKILVEGHAVQEIVKLAKEGDFGLIVIGARGLSKIREILLGSVSDGVIHHASCPVLVVK